MRNDNHMIYGSVDQHGYESIALPYVNPPALRRYVGKCRECGAARKLEGVLCTGRRGAYSDQVVVTAAGAVHRCGDNGSNVTIAHVRCGDHWCKVTAVYDAHKPSSRKPRHECNAKCLASTGPSCECKCRGANHGASAI